MGIGTPLPLHVNAQNGGVGPRGEMGFSLYLAKDTVLFKTVENEGFKCLLKVFDPQYELPCRKYFSNIDIHCT